MDERYSKIELLYKYIHKANSSLNNARKQNKEENILKYKDFVSKAKILYEDLNSKKFQIDYLQEVDLKNKFCKLEKKYKFLSILETKEILA